MLKLKQFKLLPQAIWALTLLLAVNTGSSVPVQAAESQLGVNYTSHSVSNFDTYDKGFVNHWLAPGTYLSVSQIRPGMIGYGLSVFHGTTIERFNVKIIGVVKRVLYGRDAILARLSGAAMEKNSVIKGMSGSPVYIGGKLIGAVSFGYDFAKEPIVGITPIESMLDGLAVEQSAPVPLSELPKPYWLQPQASEGEMVTTGGGSPHLVPLMSPVGLVGFSSRAEEFLADQFAPIGLSVSSGAAGALDPSLASKLSAGGLQAGSAVSVLLSTGDFTSVATGTATARFGSHVIAFGHPFLQAGAVDFPMATAYVHDILPSLAVSFKVSSPISVVGSIVADRPWSVGGQLGRASQLIPATYEVIDDTRHVQRTFHCQIVNHPDLTPEFLAATAMSAIDATHQSGGPYIAHVQSVIEAQGLAPICREDTFASNFVPHWLTDSPNRFHLLGDPVGAFVLRTTADLTKNEFQQAPIKSINLKIRLSDGRLTARLDKVYLDKPYAHPGDTLKVHCLLKPYNGQSVVQTVELKLPDNLPDGSCLLGVVGGNELTSMKKKMGTANPSPESLEDIANQINENGRGDAIVLTMALPYQKVFANGVELINPPPQWMKVLTSNHQTKEPTVSKASLTVAEDCNWLIEGSHLLTVEIRAEDKALTRKAAPELAQIHNDDNIDATEDARKFLQANKKTTGSENAPKPDNTQPGATTANAAPTANASATEKTSDKKESSSFSKFYPHMRATGAWTQSTIEQFLQGKLDNLTVDSLGRLQPSFQELKQSPLESELIIWSAAASHGNYYFASGSDIWKVDNTGDSPICLVKLQSALAPAMVADASGHVYFAKVSGGSKAAEIWRFDNDDKAKLITSIAEPIITSLCADDGGNIYAGCAGSGKVYKVSASGNTSLFFHCPEMHVLCLFYCQPESKLYVGTGDKGAVYSVEPNGNAQAVYQAKERLVTGVAKNQAGDLYISTADNGKLIKLTPDHQSEEIATSSAFYKMAYDRASDMIFTGDGEGDITLVGFDPLSSRSYFLPIFHSEEEAVMALACDTTGHLFAGTSNLAGIHTFSLTPNQTASYQSSIGDAKRLAQWSHLRAFSSLGQKDNNIAQFLAVETRTGVTSIPDATWSNWQVAPFAGQSYAIKSPAGRFLQYKLSWNQGDRLDKSLKPEVGKIEVSYLPGNQKPQISAISIKSGEAISGTKDISITGTDPDQDNLLLSIDISKDGGNTWRNLATDMRRATATPVSDTTAKENKADTQPGEQPASAETSKDEKPTSEDDSKIKPEGEDKPKLPSASKRESKLDEEIGDDFSGQLLDDSSSQASESKVKDTSKKPNETSKNKTQPLPPVAVKPPTTIFQAEKFVYHFNTKKEKNGNYLLKFTVCDRLSNPIDYQQCQSLQAVTIDNRPPEIQFIEASRLSDGTLKLLVRVKDKYTSIANATYRLDDGEPYCLAFTDGAGDDLETTLTGSGAKLLGGSHKVEIKIVDQAGNSASKSASVK